MSANTIEHRMNTSTDTNRGPSPAIWADCPVLDIIEKSRDGIYFFDDFEDFGLPGTQTTEINLGRYKVYNTGSGTVITDVMPHDVTGTRVGAGGIISQLCDTAGDQSVIGTHACPFTLSTTSKKLWFEARIASTSVATAMTHIFVGLGNNSEVTFGAAIPLADADATGTAVALLGFTRLEDGTTTINSSYTDKAAAYTHVQTGVGTMAAETWIKLGFVFDPDAPNANRIAFYVNGVKGTSYMTHTTLTGLTHLDAMNLGPVFAQFADTSGTANYAYMDWWRCAQLQ